MNHKLYKYMRINMNQNNNINELYRIFWINTLKQFKENNEETGLYFWLQKDNENYVIFHHGIHGLIEETIKMTEEEKEAVMNRLTNDGFKISKTKNKSILLTINKKAILDFIEKKQNQEEISTFKIQVTTFAEARKRK